MIKLSTVDIACIITIVLLFILEFIKSKKYKLSYTTQLKDSFGISDGLKNLIPEEIETIGTGKKKYQIYENNNNEIVIVKEGWSFPAFFFFEYWYIYKKLYRGASNLFLIKYILYIALSIEYYSPLNIAFLLFIHCIIGIKSNQWYAVDLIYFRRFKLKKHINANSKKSAKQLYNDIQKVNQ